jgi:hypothetical protein
MDSEKDWIEAVDGLCGASKLMATQIARAYILA